MPVRMAVSSETPVTPPSRKLLGNRNPFNPIEAERIPNEIKITSFTILTGLTDLYFCFSIVFKNQEKYFENYFLKHHSDDFRQDK